MWFRGRNWSSSESYSKGDLVSHEYFELSWWLRAAYRCGIGGILPDKIVERGTTKHGPHLYCLIESGRPSLPPDQAGEWIPLGGMDGRKLVVPRDWQQFRA